MKTARDRGDVAEAARLDTQFQQLKSQVESWGVALNADGSVPNLNSVDLIADIKMDPAVASQQRAAELEALRISMEAAADAWAQEQALDPNSKVRKHIDEFLSNNVSYINNNQNLEIVVGYTYDAQGNEIPIKETLSDVIQKGFGSQAIQGKFVPDAVFKGQTSFDLQLTQNVTFDGHSYSKVKYKLDADGKNYVPYGVDAQGNEVEITGHPEYSSYKKEEFFETIRKKIAAGKVKKADAKTAVAVAADKGKTSSTHVRRTDYADKINRKRQSEDAKGGGKR